MILHCRGIALPTARGASSAVKACRHRAATAADAGGGGQAYPYNGSDGTHQKATLEHVFGAQQHRGDLAIDEQPSTSGSPIIWGVGFQMSERNLVWNDQLKVMLIKRIARDQLGINDEEMEQRLAEVSVLLPGLEQRLTRAPPELVARCCASTDRIASRLLRLKLTFPEANLVLMISNQLSLLLDEDLDVLARNTEKLRAMLGPSFNVDAFVADFPFCALDPECIRVAFDDVRRLVPGTDPVQLLRSQPDVVLSLVRGKQLLVYDPPTGAHE